MSEDPMRYDVPEPEDEFTFWRGLFWGIVFSIVIWGMIGALVYVIWIK